MRSEAKKSAFRILANYTRLLSTLALGILVVPLTIRWLGDAAFGLIALLGANIGLASIFRQIIQQSLTRELGAAYHEGDDVFRANYRVICLLSLICAVLSLGAFAVVLVLIPQFQMPEAYHGAARWFVIGQGIHTATMVLLSPMLNMFLVTERFVGYNLWFIAVRASNIISVLVLGYAIGIDDPVQGLKLHGILWSTLGTLGLLVAAGFIYTRDRRLMLRFGRVRREALDDVLGTFSWNSAVQVAMNLHEQIPPLLLNLFVGPLANAAWGIGFRFVAYIRMATNGIQFGSDAVSARMASGEDSDQARQQLQRLLGVQTRLTTLVAFPVGLGVFFYCWPIFHVWVGSSLESYDEVMPTAVLITRVVTWAIAARAISDTWMLVLYGAGFVKSYAKWVIAGGVIAPVASLILMKLVPAQYMPIAPPAMMAAVFVCIHLLGFPFITAKCLHIKPMSLLFSLSRPLIASLVALACAIGTLMAGPGLGDLGFGIQITESQAGQLDWVYILSSMAVFGSVYAAMAFGFVLTTQERQRMFGLLKRLRRSSSKA